MKTICLFFCLCFSILIAQGQTFSKADSVRIFGFQHNMELLCPVNRANFFDYVKDMTDTTTNRENLDPTMLCAIEAGDHVDLMVTDKNEVSTLLSLLTELKVKNRLEFSTKQTCLSAYYAEYNNDVTWTPTDDLDNRLLLILYHKRQTEFVWIGDSWLVDRGYFRYELSYKLAEFLSKYTHVFNSFLQN